MSIQNNNKEDESVVQRSLEFNYRNDSEMDRTSSYLYLIILAQLSIIRGLTNKSFNRGDDIIGNNSSEGTPLLVGEALLWL